MKLLHCDKCGHWGMSTMVTRQSHRPEPMQRLCISKAWSWQGHSFPGTAGNLVVSGSTHLGLLLGESAVSLLSCLISTLSGRRGDRAASFPFRRSRCWCNLLFVPLHGHLVSKVPSKDKTGWMTHHSGKLNCATFCWDYRSSPQWVTLLSVSEKVSEGILCL